jgi:hypothetical protein
MTDMMVKIMAEVLDILGTATKEMKQSRASEAIFFVLGCSRLTHVQKISKRVAGITKLEDGLKKLEKMTNEETRMANAEVMRIAHDINKKVEGSLARMSSLLSVRHRPIFTMVEYLT